jgi:hypothetical protein
MTDADDRRCEDRRLARQQAAKRRKNAAHGASRGKEQKQTSPNGAKEILGSAPSDFDFWVAQRFSAAIPKPK